MKDDVTKEELALTDKQKKTIMQWVLYIGKAVVVAVVKKLTGGAV